MKSLVKISSIIVLSIFLSCNSSKTSTSTSKNVKNYIEEGYTIGKLDKSNSQCNLIIIDEKKNIKYDPINVDDEKFSFLKKTNKKVYFKFLSLRMANRCKDALPIKLTKVVLIE